MPRPLPMAPGDFQALVSAVNGEAFSDNRLGTIFTAAASAWFTVDQVGSLVDLLTHSSDKDAVKALLR